MGVLPVRSGSRPGRFLFPPTWRHTMTPLRQRFIDDLRLRNYAQRTIETYVYHLARFAKHFARSPDQLGAEHVRDFQLHLLSQRVSWSAFNQAVCALRFFFATTCGKSDLVRQIPYGNGK